MGEYGAGGALSAGSRQYIWLPTPPGPMPVATVQNNSAVQSVMADHLNTPCRVMHADGTLLWQWPLSAFGETPPTIAQRRFATVAPVEGEFEFNLRYPGQYFDKESELHYNGFRTYDPKTGRYTQPDPIGLAGGWNRFNYAGGNALAFSDPNGLQARSVNRALGGFGAPSGPHDGHGGYDPRTDIYTPSPPSTLQRLLTGVFNNCQVALDWMFSANENNAPPIPDEYIGDQSRERTSNSGNRHTSGPLTPSNGGTGDAGEDFDFLTGGTGRPFADTDSRSRIPGARVGDNGFWIRPGSASSGSGSRIEIPGNGSKLPETLHY